VLRWPRRLQRKEDFTSPSNHDDLVVVAYPSPLSMKSPPIEKIGKLLSGIFVEAKNLAHTVYTREYHGNGWILDQANHWIADRYLWTADESGLFVADAETNTILFNNVLEAYAKNSAADEWVAIRFRPSARIQEYLEEKFQDIVWKNGAVSAVQYDTNLRETARTAIDLRVDSETALSVWLKKDLAPVSKRILSDPRTFQSVPASPAP
jgi:hypothetical protein